MVELNRILCPVDFSEYSEHALGFAMRMAKWYGARLHVVHVMPPLVSSTMNALAETSRAITSRNLTALIANQRVGGVEISSEIIESADATATILESANRFDADLIVTGSHGRSGLERVLLGSVVEALLHRSGRPVLAIPSHIDPRRVSRVEAFGRILCAVDFADASLAGLAYALSIAEESDAKLTLLNVIERPPDWEQVRNDEEAASRERLLSLIPEHARDYCTVETAVLEGGSSRQIIDLANAQDADLIVLGVHGRNAFDLAFFGSNSKDVIRQAHCPVLIVPVSRHVSLRAAS